MSDTHSLTSHITREIPDGDIFIHAGDFTRSGALQEVKEFNTWVGELKHPHKIVIAGNHELSLDDGYHPNKESRQIGIDIGHFLKKNEEINESHQTSKEDVRRELTNVTYLQDSGVTLYGLKIYGSPWQPEFGGWAFNLNRGSRCLDKWDLIPDDTDILITHSPPWDTGITAPRASSTRCSGASSPNTTSTDTSMRDTECAQMGKSFSLTPPPVM
ncbi:Uncharacterized protein FKW44_009528 [Caligus rogercresseyi]|uniref:Calcineurin-like phosphoesterase domain-containing protein n=1 Tax=Caligus rogercresseyi TaxID=217165 RepID=A0A7T8K6Q4_CALRO|nr:Uncharacterized protein FKW44_009528 [Caligus rogercresseyi]